MSCGTAETLTGVEQIPKTALQFGYKSSSTNPSLEAESEASQEGKMRMVFELRGGKKKKRKSGQIKIAGS